MLVVVVARNACAMRACNCMMWNPRACLLIFIFSTFIINAVEGKTYVGTMFVL